MNLRMNGWLGGGQMDESMDGVNIKMNKQT